MKLRRNESMTRAETLISTAEVLSSKGTETLKKFLEGKPAHPQDAQNKNSDFLMEKEKIFADGQRTTF